MKKDSNVICTQENALKFHNALLYHVLFEELKQRKTHSSHLSESL